MRTNKRDWKEIRERCEKMGWRGGMYKDCVTNEEVEVGIVTVITILR